MSGDDDVRSRDGIVDECRLQLAIRELDEHVADLRANEVLEGADSRRLAPHIGRRSVPPVFQPYGGNDRTPIDIR